MKKIDVVALGELLIDFTENAISKNGNPLFEANPGGAPCNVLSMLNKLGRKVEFIGKVGNDNFGHQLKNVLNDVGIGTSCLKEDDKVHTTLALVHKLENGDRDFSFYRSPGADMMLAEDEIDEELIKNSTIFHFGSLSMTNEPVKSATKKALSIAEKTGIIRSFDPNLRPPLWESLDKAKEAILYGMAHCDVLKISDNEIQWLTAKDDFTDGVNELNKNFDIKLITVTMGKDGSRAYYKGNMVEVPGFVRKDTLDTTGAGDTFTGCLLHFVLEYGLDNLNDNILKECLRFANAAASIVTTRYGALKVMPNMNEINEVLKK